MSDTLKILLFIALLAWSFFGTGVYAAVANKLTKNREPWFTITMIAGLAFSSYVTSLISGATFQMCFWVFVVATLCFLALHRLFGKSGSIEMFMTPHVLVVLTILLLPALHDARVKAQKLGRQQQPHYETTNQK